MSGNTRAGCVYCGLPRARVRSSAEHVAELPACIAHDDLLGVDPAFDLAGHLAALAYPALELGRAPSSLRRERSASPSPRPLAFASERG